MRKIIHQKNNPANALEVRLENGDPDKYTVIVAGMTIINPNSSKADNEYLFIENDTYHEYQLKTYHEAKRLYDSYTAKYLS